MIGPHSLSSIKREKMCVALNAYRLKGHCNESAILDLSEEMEMLFENHVNSLN